MASTEVDYQPAGEKKTGIAASIQGFKNYLWNPEKGEVMGRTGSSWGKIGIFYLIFYSCLAAFFAAFLAGLLSLMDDQFPNQTGMNSLIKGNPGMGFRPQSDVEQTLIKFTQGVTNNKTYIEHIDNIVDFLDQYSEENINKSVQERPGGVYPDDCTNGLPADVEKQACLFDIESIMEDMKCTRENNFGFNEGQPCILLKMNKVYAWKPETHTNESLPDDPEVKAAYKPGFLTVTCEGENDVDHDIIGEVEYFPKGGFDTKFYPYFNQPGYRSPLVFAKFNNPLGGTLIQVFCKVWAKNIYHDNNDKAGSVHFELQVDKDPNALDEESD